MQIIITDYVATVGELAYSFEIWYLCLFSAATFCPLILIYLFFLSNMWDSNTLFIWVSYSFSNSFFYCPWSASDSYCSAQRCGIYFSNI